MPHTYEWIAFFLVCIKMISRRRSRALSRANIKHDVRRGSRTPSRGNILLNVNEKRTKCHRTPRDVSPDQRFVSPRERKAWDERLPLSESPKSSREREEILGDHDQDLQPPTPQVRIIRSSTESLTVSLYFWFWFWKIKLFRLRTERIPRLRKMWSVASGAVLGSVNTTATCPSSVCSCSSLWS